MKFRVKSYASCSILFIFLLSYSSFAQPIHWDGQVFDNTQISEVLGADKSGSTFNNCTFRNTSYPAGSVIFSLTGADNVLFENCTFQDLEFIGNTAMILIREGNNITFNRCTFENLTMISGPDGSDIMAIVIDPHGGTIENITIKNSDFHNIAADGMQIGHDSYNYSGSFIGSITVDSCRFWNDEGLSTENAIDIKASDGPFVIKNCEISGFRGCNRGEGCSGDPGYGIIIHYTNSKNITVEKCKIYDCNIGLSSEIGADNGSIREGPPKNITFRNNFIYDCNTNIWIAGNEKISIINNTLVNALNRNFSSSGSNTDVSNKNNLFAGSGSWYNVYGGQGNIRFSDASSAGFVDLAGKDFHLQPTSAAVDSGVTDSSVVEDIDSEARPTGSRYDVGADELVDLTAFGSEDLVQPNEFALHQNFPNPFNPKTVISYQLSEISDIELSIYNLIGQRVATLVSERQGAGTYQVDWDASGYASGIYFYRIIFNHQIKTGKMILMK